MHRVVAPVTAETRVIARVKPSPSPISPRNLKSASGLAALMNANASIRRMTHGGMPNLFLGNEAEGGRELEATALIGLRSCSVVQCDTGALAVSGEW